MKNKSTWLTGILCFLSVVVIAQNKSGKITGVITDDEAQGVASAKGCISLSQLVPALVGIIKLSHYHTCLPAAMRAGRLSNYQIAFSRFMCNTHKPVQFSERASLLKYS